MRQRELKPTETSMERARRETLIARAHEELLEAAICQRRPTRRLKMIAQDLLTLLRHPARDLTRASEELLR